MQTLFDGVQVEKQYKVKWNNLIVPTVYAFMEGLGETVFVDNDGYKIVILSKRQFDGFIAWATKEFKLDQGGIFPLQEKQ